MALPTNIEDLFIASSVDINGALFQVPEDASDAMYAKVTPMTVDKVTTGAIGGTGAFDQIMAGMRVQLQAEFDNNRITGSEYTQAYIALTTAALNTAVQFALGADNNFWSSQTSQIQAISARISMESARFSYQNILPAQFALVAEQGNAQRGQTSDIRLDGLPVTGVMGAQESLYKQQIISYQRDAEVKAAKLFTDAWITQKTIDDGLVPPTGFTNNSINEVLTVIMANNTFGTPVA